MYILVHKKKEMNTGLSKKLSKISILNGMSNDEPIIWT